MSKDICCQYTVLDNIIATITGLYNQAYYKSKHPMVDYIYKIYDEMSNVGLGCIGGGFVLP